jgi:uncharacterized protein YggE
MNNYDYTYSTVRLYFMVTIGIMVGALLLLIPAFDLNKVNGLIFAQYNPSSSSFIRNSLTNTTSNNATITSSSGMASANVKPDKVTFSLGIETTNKTANAAIIENSKLMNTVINALKSAGVKDNESSTSSFNISPNYSRVGMKGNITGFTVTNYIKLVSSNTANVSKWIDVSISAGANIINGIYFSLSDNKLAEIKNTLIKNAINDALKKADITASILGLRVAEVRSVNLNVPLYNLPFSANLANPQSAVATGSNAASPLVVPGEQQVTEEVSIVVLLRK